MKLFVFLFSLIAFVRPVLLQAQVTTWPVPTSNKLVANFGEYRPKYTAPGPHFHGGIDVGGTLLIPVVSAGVISNIGYTITNGYQGDYVVVTHPDESQTWYLELNSSSFVSIGNAVSIALANSPTGTLDAGTTIGQMGNSDTGGPGVHFEVRSRNDNTFRLNPLSFLTNPDSAAPTIEANNSYVFKPLNIDSWIIPQGGIPTHDLVNGQVVTITGAAITPYIISGQNTSLIHAYNPLPGFSNKLGLYSYQHALVNSSAGGATLAQFSVTFLGVATPDYTNASALYSIATPYVSQIVGVPKSAPAPSTDFYYQTARTGQGVTNLFTVLNNVIGSNGAASSIFDQNGNFYSNYSSITDDNVAHINAEADLKDNNYFMNVWTAPLPLDRLVKS